MHWPAFAFLVAFLFLDHINPLLHRRDHLESRPIPDTGHGEHEHEANEKPREIIVRLLAVAADGRVGVRVLGFQAEKAAEEGADGQDDRGHLRHPAAAPLIRQPATKNAPG